ncbi:phosphate ABC transporter ATP-binding protein [Alkalihalophilus pseudofirmus OF4]|uniref:Phosphate ABC transporter ATP-binding protein n=1 Tax=Alkalihalophilus pseudofirmus (strain ATCC BAA-2126 / JCM 17055 / OF4) TaxID=398511 RepID=D3FYK9_ALKPO|nr:phosphate ABC transporter ATP-binding protein [Alkalihalophilus pseudofirmus]ADC50861.1 phosphate ABC transporter ATP-binding protein [Alkalihalophilus pseudofirmus OF4]
MEIIKWSNVSSERLNKISFTVLENQIVTLIGPSGAGKSSLLYLMNRLDDKRSGSITFKEKEIESYPIVELRQQIGMVFQSPALFDGTVSENVSYGPNLHNRDWSDEKTIKLLESVHLSPEFLHKPIDELSGGEQQRVAFLRTLANEPEILLLDEVTSALDLRNVELIEDFIRTLQKRGKTIFMVTHDVEQAERLGDQTFYLEKGELIETGESKEFFRSPQTERARRFLYRDGEGDE